MGIDFNKVFQNTLNVIGEVLSQVVIEGAANQPRVQEEIEKVKTNIVKTAWWKAAPFIIVGGGIFLLSRKFK